MFKQCQQHLCRFSLSSLPRSPGAFLFSRSRFLFLSFLPSRLLFTGYSSSLFKPSRLLLTLISVSVTPIKNLSCSPFSLSVSCSLLFSLFLHFPLGVVYMCNYYYVVVIHATLRHVQTRLARVRQDGSIRVQYVPSLPHGLTLAI